MIKYRKIPALLGWELTLNCNMNCMHCGSSAGQSRTKELTTKEALAVCDQIRELKVKSVGITGGEAIVRKDWPIIIKKLRDLGIQVNILSNGWGITKEIIDQFKTLGISSVAISIDGGIQETHDTIRNMTGSFAKCIATLEQLKQKHIPSTVITTVHKGNFKELPRIRDTIFNLTNAWQIQIAVPFGRFPKDLMLSKEEFYSLAMFIAATRKKYPRKQLVIIGAHSIGYHSHLVRNTMANPVWNGCQGGLSTMSIQSNGNVKGCLSLPDEFIEGNVKEKSLKQIWNDPTAFSYSRDFQKSQLKNDCVQCKYGNTCRGGCTTVSTSLTGMPHADPYCLHLIEKNELVN
jgi:radical SAM protein with 4Fe4S-binding SPASM domain